MPPRRALWLLLLLQLWLQLWLQLCLQLCPRPAAAARRDRKGRKEPPEPLNSSLANGEEQPQLLQPPEPRLADPRRTWISFVHRPDDGSSSRRRCKGKDKKLRGLVGPPGPPGPQGPPGAPGAEITREILLQEFKEILKEAMEQRASQSLPVPPSLLPPLLAQPQPRPRLEQAFHCRLRAPLLVDKKTLVELHNFQALPARGSFLRGPGLDLGSGRFTAPVSGIYQFSASVHLDHSELKSKAQLRPRDHVRVLICIESLCHRHTSLEVIAGLESNSKIFTVYVHGLLQLQAGQYTSIFVDNSAGAAITVQPGSDFMGMLMGA